MPKGKPLRCGSTSLTTAVERALKAPLRAMANSPCWSVVGQGCGFQVFSVGSRQMSVNVSRCTLPTHTPFVPFTVVRGRGILRSWTLLVLLFVPSIYTRQRYV